MGRRTIRMSNNLRLARRTAWVSCALALGCTPTAAGEFSVNPIRLELGSSARSGSITVRNEGKERLRFQLEAMEWTQDRAGKDQYTQTQDVVFAPKIMSIEAGHEGIVRVGTRTPTVPVEKTFRLFIEELPSPEKSAETSRAQLSVLVRFGAPIFVGPLRPSDSFELQNLSLRKGAVNFEAKNTGNRHQLIQGIQIKGMDQAGGEVYALTLADRYFLAGTTKQYSAAVPTDKCSGMTLLVVEIKTDKTTTQRKLDVSRAMCS